MTNSLKKWIRSIGQRLTLLTCAKFAIAAMLVAPLAVVVSIIGSCEFYMSQAVSSCNCYGEKIALARIAFEKGYQITAYLFPLINAALAVPIFLLPWTRVRIVILLGALIAGCIAWESYPSYVALLPSTEERWWSHPVRSVTAAPYSEIARVFIAPLLEWRSGCTMAAFACTYLACEMISYAVRFARRASNSTKVKSTRSEAADSLPARAEG